MDGELPEEEYRFELEDNPNKGHETLKDFL